MHVIRHHRHRADDRALPDAHPLVDARQPADDHVVAQHAMPGDGDVVDQDHPVADLRVMADMRAGHDQAVVAHPRDPAAALGAGVQRRALADAAALADDQPGVLALDTSGPAAPRPRWRRERSRVPSPISVQPVTTAWLFTVTPARQRHLGPDQRRTGRPCTPAPIAAPGSTTAEGWMRASGDTVIASGLRARRTWP